MRRAGALLLAATAAWIVWTAAGRAQSVPDGKQLFERRCSGCHSLDRDKEGPRLRGVYGRAAGTVESFDYSDALKKSGITWDAAKLDQWLTDPDKLVPANDMPFRLPDAQERQAIIAYLKDGR
jgi:cytochrome c